MNDLSPPTDRVGTDTPDGIDQGRRLIRVGEGRGLSLAERLSERLHRLTWRTPLHAMRLKGRYPLRLIAVPDDPIPGDVTRGQALLAGELCFRGEARAIDAIDLARPDWSHAFGEHLHSFAWLRDLSRVATRARGAPIAEALTARWLAAHAERVSDEAWRPGLCGRRILFWTAHAPLILSSTDLVYRSAVLNALARGARHLDRVADKAAGADRVAAWCGVIAAGLLIPGGDPRRAIGEAGLVRALGGALFGDGGAVSRSPVQLLDMMALLAMLGEAYDARNVPVPEAIGAATARMVPALLAVRHADGGLSSWQGGGPVLAETLAQTIDACGVRARPLRQARDWGYQRLVSGSTVLIVDAAPPPVGQAIEGGCASTLAFELSDGPLRLIVNCGGARAGVASLPTALTQALRSTAAHSTLVLADSNSTALNADGTLGRGVGEVALARQESEAASRIEASHDGYIRRFGFRHRRQLVLTEGGRELRGEDALLPEGRARRAGPASFALRFHLGEDVDPVLTSDGQAAVLRGPEGELWQFRCRGGALAIEDSLWIDGEGRPVGTRQLVISGEAPAGGASASWVFKRAA